MAPLIAEPDHTAQHRHLVIHLRTLLAPLSPEFGAMLLAAFTWTLTEVLEEARQQQFSAANVDQRSAGSWHPPTPEVAETGVRVASVPCWWSRNTWLEAVITTLDTSRGREARRRRHRVAASTVIAAAEAHAQFASSDTGRQCTAALSTLAAHAGLSDDQIKNARGVLRDLGLLVDIAFGRHLTGIEIMQARAHHGGTQRAIGSEVSLSMPRHVVAMPTETDGDAESADTIASTHADPTEAEVGSDNTKCTPLPSLGSLNSLSLAKESGNSKEKHLNRNSVRQSANSPRPIGLQRLTAQLLARTVGLDEVSQSLAAARSRVPRSWQHSDFYHHTPHLGRFCDVVAEVGIDPADWSAAQITNRLDHDARTNGLSWPDRIANPVAYLRWRLKRLDWTERAPQKKPSTGQVIDRLPEVKSQPATATQRQRHLAAIAEACGWTRGRKEETATPI